MISYFKQVAVCRPVLDMIRRAVTQSKDAGLRAKVLDIPTTESLLRVVSVQPKIDTEEELKDFITKHILDSLQLTEIQREHLNLNG